MSPICGLPIPAKHLGWLVEMFYQNDEFSIHRQGAGLFVGSKASQTKLARSRADSLQLTAPTRRLDTIGLSLAVLWLLCARMARIVTNHMRAPKYLGVLQGLQLAKGFGELNEFVGIPNCSQTGAHWGNIGMRVSLCWWMSGTFSMPSNRRHVHSDVKSPRLQSWATSGGCKCK